MPKYYVMLVDDVNHQMLVPVKALLNPYNDQPAYCAGMPQFFGGTSQDDDHPAVTLEHEITQESRRTLELTSGNPHSFYSEGNMFFYWANEDQWVRTGTVWGPALNNDEAEMDHIVAVDLRQFTNVMDDNEIINELLGQTLAAPPSIQAINEFNESATKSAFIHLVRIYLEE